MWTIKGTNLGKDATCFADGVGSIKPGARLDVLLADDMVGIKENATPLQRQKSSETYWQVVDPMLVPGSKRWYIGTRWHEDDFYAELTRKGVPTYQRRSLEDSGPPVGRSHFAVAAVHKLRVGRPGIDATVIGPHW